MTKRRVPLAPTDEERALFLQAAAGARPIVHDKIHHEAPLPPAIPRSHLRDEAAALAESLTPEPLDLMLEGGDEATFLRPGLARTVLRDLRRGRWVVQDHLDLHGSTRDEARTLLANFLAEVHQRGLRCVRVVHGKGHNSPGREPVLKGLVKGWLMQRTEVLAYCQARTVDGGAGAVVVLLKAAKKK